MVVDGDGDVGIGTTNPTEQLHTSSGRVRFGDETRYSKQFSTGDPGSTTTFDIAEIDQSARYIIKIIGSSTNTKTERVHHELVVVTKNYGSGSIVAQHVTEHWGTGSSTSASVNNGKLRITFDDGSTYGYLSTHIIVEAYGGVLDTF